MDREKLNEYKKSSTNKKLHIMTRRDIAREIARRTGYGLDNVRRVMEEFINVVTDSVVSGEGVYLRGFGTFSQITRAAKTARNIKKGTAITIPERKDVKFKPSGYFIQKLG